LKKAGFTKIENLKGGILAWGEKVELSASKY
jgi:rhodanese-related sulfurtransferase